MNNEKHPLKRELEGGVGISAINCISVERVFIMGVAMASIMLFHQPFVSAVLLSPFHLFGHFGVDVFLFLSGMGIAGSLQRNNLGTFYWNRLVRIIPAWVLVKLTIYAAILYKNGFSGSVAYFISEFFNLWFLDALVLFYIFSPLLLAWTKKFGLRGIVWTAIAVEVFQVARTCGCFPKLHLPLAVGLGLPRLPVYLLGLLMVSNESQARKVLFNVKLSLLTLFAAMLVPLYLCISGLLANKIGLNLPRAFSIHFFAFPILAFAVPFVCLRLAKLACVLKKCKIYIAFLPFGMFSLELYLWHEWLYSKIRMWMHLCSISAWLWLLVGISSSLVLAWLTHEFCRRCVIPFVKRK